MRSLWLKSYNFFFIFQTPLYLAVVAKQPQMVSMFVQRNANPNSMAQVSNLVHWQFPSLGTRLSL